MLLPNKPGQTQNILVVTGTKIDPVGGGAEETFFFRALGTTTNLTDILTGLPTYALYNFQINGATEQDMHSITYSDMTSERIGILGRCDYPTFTSANEPKSNFNPPPNDTYQANSMIFYASFDARAGDNYHNSPNIPQYVSGDYVAVSGMDYDNLSPSTNPQDVDHLPTNGDWIERSNGTKKVAVGVNWSHETSTVNDYHHAKFGLWNLDEYGDPDPSYWSEELDDHFLTGTDLRDPSGSVYRADSDPINSNMAYLSGGVTTDDLLKQCRDGEETTTGFASITRGVTPIYQGNFPGILSINLQANDNHGTVEDCQNGTTIDTYRVLGEQELDGPGSIQAFFNAEAQIEVISPNHNISEIKVFNMAGQQVQVDPNCNGKNCTADFQHQPSGLYIVSILTDNSTRSNIRLMK